MNKTIHEILGVSARSYRGPGHELFGVNVTVVLVAGDPDVGEYAAYVGIGGREAVAWIAANGDKISFEEASAHFPGQLEKERYRP